jgi:nucleotide-binding universal stress UspA family protein
MSNVLQKLLVPIDGSDASALAIQYAMRLARQFQASIVFCHSVDIAGVQFTPYDAAGAGIVIDELEHQCVNELTAAVQQATAAECKSSTLELAGSAATSICDAAVDQGVSAIVMGTEGRDGASRFFLGSVTEGVLRSCAVPVFTVSPAQRGAIARQTSLSRILVAVDESDPSDAAIDFAIAIGTPGATTIELASVVADGLDDPYAEYDRACQYLQDKSEYVRGARLAVERSIIEGDPAKELVALAERQSADLIAIGTHGRRGLLRMTLGSVAEHVVRTSTIPVVVLHKRAQSVPQIAPAAAPLRTAASTA